MNNVIVNRFLVGVILLTIVFLIFVFGLLLWPITVITANRQPYEVPVKTVERGKAIEYIVDSCKHMDVPSVVSRTFIDAEGVQFPSTSSINNVPAGCRKTTVRTPVPGYLAPGRYSILLNVTYKVNYVRDITYTFKTEEFEVK